MAFPLSPIYYLLSGWSMSCYTPLRRFPQTHQPIDSPYKHLFTASVPYVLTSIDMYCSFIIFKELLGFPSITVSIFRKSLWTELDPSTPIKCTYILIDEHFDELNLKILQERSIMRYFMRKLFWNLLSGKAITLCVSLDKSHHLSGPRFLQWWNEHSVLILC